MKITTFGKNINVTEGIKKNVEKEFGRLEKVVPDSAVLKVTVSAVKGRRYSHRAEASLSIDGDVIRAECESPNLYDSINESSDILLRRVKKYNSLNRHFENKTIRTAADIETEAPADDEEEITIPEISRIKNINIAKESREDAALHMDFLGHPFHLFVDEETNAPAVVYKRGDGTVGVLLTAE